MKRSTRYFRAIAIAVPVFLFIVVLLLVQSSREPVPDRESLAVDGSEAPSAPSAQKVWLVNAVRDATGRNLDIEGELDLDLLPNPGLLLGRASLSNAEGFGDTPFAAIDGFEFRVSSLSPFERRLNVDRLALAGLRLNLARNAEGASNWSGVAGDSEAARTLAPEAQGGTWDVSFDAIEITDAEISWQDALTGREWKLGEIDFVASELRPGESFPVAFSFDFESAETAVSIESAMRASATENQLRLEGLSIELLISQLNPADLMAVLESMSITPDPGVLARAGTSTSVNFSGDGTVDFRTMALDLRGVMQLPDGAMLPLTIGGTLEAPSIELEASR